MGRVLTNNVSLRYAREAEGFAGYLPGDTHPTAGALSGSPSWQITEPNDIGSYGAEITTVAREPISDLRQQRKGTVTDLDSSVEFEADLTMSAVEDFIEGWVFAQAVNYDMSFEPSGVDGTTDGYTVSALTAAQSAKLEFSAGEYATLLYARNFTNSANNGIKSLDADLATSGTALTVAENLVDEASPPSTALVELCGLRSLASAADFTWDWDAPSKTATLTSAGDITDFTQFGLTVGQLVHIGSPDGSGGVTNAFENAAAHDMYGYARIKSFGTGTIVFDKVSSALQFDDAVAPTTAVDILFGRFIRNVRTSSAEYKEISFQFEASYPGLGSSNQTMYHYAKGNFCNELTIDLPGQDKAMLDFGFIGTDTDNPTLTRKTNASSAKDPKKTTAVNTSADIVRLRITDVDEDGLTTDFQDTTITLNNQVSPEKVLAVLGARYMNTGNFLVDLETTIIFTNSEVIDRIRANTTVSMDMILTNNDGAVSIDIPSMTLGDGSLDLPQNESVKLSVSGQAFVDPLLNTSIGISLFPVTP